MPFLFAAQSRWGYSRAGKEMTFFDQTTNLPIQSVAPYSFWCDPDTRTSVLVEECADGGFQVRRDLNIGFDDSAVQCYSKAEAQQATGDWHERFTIGQPKGGLWLANALGQEILKEVRR